ncbi:MAG TPA: lysylphosphatidylglycerol synthase transmembrane domain-containing protein, partial [Gemmataceae bacterium]
VAGCALAAVVGLVLAPWVARAACGYAAGGIAASGKIARLAASVRDALAVYRREPRLIVSSTALSALIQASSVLQVGLLGMAVGLDVPWAVYGVATPMVSLLTLLPVSLNGMGVREAGLVLFLAPADVSAGSAVTVALLWFGTQTAAGLLGLGVFLAGGYPRPEVRHDDALGHHPDQGRAGQRRPAA